MPWSVPGTAPQDEEDSLGGEAAAAIHDDDAEAAALDAGGLYAALNLPRDADEEAVRRAYRSLAGACHPDKVAPDLREAASEQFARLQRAYEVNSRGLARERGERADGTRERREGAPRKPHRANQSGGRAGEPAVFITARTRTTPPSSARREPRT
jgi:curved DNA-binding protein CbpA